MSHYILTVSCPDRPGIVAAVSVFLAERNGNILDSAQFGDANTDLFFMRVEFEASSGALEDIRKDFVTIGEKFSMQWDIHNARHRTRMLVMVSRFGHCLNDLLYRWRVGSLPVEIPAIVSNHMDFYQLAAHHGIPYHHLPVDKQKNNKQRQEERLMELVEEHDIELVVLARYMQILSPELTSYLSGRCINIHHSFLPSFKGARPYHQAYEKGVKLIGATAHYVTDQLDEGPIIEQEIKRVDHRKSPDQLVAIGRDIECIALARAVKYHLERRVFVNGTKTVVFN